MEYSATHSNQQQQPAFSPHLVDASHSGCTLFI